MTFLRHYMCDHQRKWDLFVQQLTFAFNVQAHRYTSTATSSLVLSNRLPKPTTMDIQPALITNTDHGTSFQALLTQFLD